MLLTILWTKERSQRRATETDGERLREMLDVLSVGERGLPHNPLAETAPKGLWTGDDPKARGAIKLPSSRLRRDPATVQTAGLGVDQTWCLPLFLLRLTFSSPPATAAFNID